MIRVSFVILVLCTLLAQFLLVSSSSSPFQRGTISVDESGTQLVFSDTGPPSKSGYITIVAINGLGFNSNVFTVVQPVALAEGFRFVGVNRRGYGGSTPISDAEINIITNGTDTAKTSLSTALGVELLTFLDTFIQDNNITEISPDRTEGGISIVGWSFGCALVVSAIASVDVLADDMRARLATRMRAVILEEPSTAVLGMAPAPERWLPEIDPLFPVDIQGPFFAQWVTSYFDHGDLSTRDPNVLQTILPAFNTTPAIWNMKDKWISVLETGTPALIDGEIQTGLSSQLFESYRQSIFNNSIRTMLPHMTHSLFAASRSVAFAPYCLWIVQDNNTAAGGNFIRTILVPGGNHVNFWDSPEQTLDVYRKLSL